MADAGWYPDPQDPNSEHYWDGQNWSGQRRPAGSASAPPTPSGLAPGRSDEDRYQPTTVNPTWRGQAVPGQQGSGYAAQPVPGQAYQQPWASGPTAKKRGKKVPIVITAVVVVLVAAGLVIWLARPSSKPSLTYQGQPISAPADVLTAAETAVASTVEQRHGAKNSNTRCYFAKPNTPASGTKSSDVDSSLRCGPVLFVDGSTADEYLPVPLTASTSGSKTTLTPSTSLTSAMPEAVGDFTLVRPDGQTPPSGAGGLSVPAPPPADKDLLLATTLGSTSPPKSLSGSVIVGKYSRVTLIAAGEIARYGTGPDARSAPSGETLVAFQVTFGDGEIDGSGADRAEVSVNGKAREIPSASGDTWDVVAVPANSTATIVLVDGSYTQTLNLPTGKVGRGNITVLSRKNTSGLVGKSFNVPIHLSRSGESADVVFHAQASVSNLYFWPPGHDSDSPKNPGNAFLSVHLNYTDADDPGKTFGFDPAVLQLQLPSGKIVHARNLAPAGSIYNVFEVPGNYTHGTVSITGSEKVDHGVTLRVSTTKTFRVNIAAG